jgi:putative NADPH-quinone reductase
MRVLLVFAHPSRESFCGAILATVEQALNAKGHQIELLDLYQEKFDPVMSRLDWQSYEALDHPAVQPYDLDISDMELRDASHSKRLCGPGLGTQHCVSS